MEDMYLKESCYLELRKTWLRKQECRSGGMAFPLVAQQVTVELKMSHMSAGFPIQFFSHSVLSPFSSII